MKPYTVFAQFYDTIMEEVPYHDWVDYLEKLFTIYGVQGKRVLDLACGTGSLSCILASRGYQVIGLDLSSTMLSMARKKGRGEENPRYVQGDMRDFSLEENVHMVISTHDSLNYMHSEEDLFSVFSSVYRALYPKGLFIFDVNTIDGLKRMGSGTRLKEGDGFYCFWVDTYNHETCQWQIHLTFFIRQDNGTYDKEEETHLETAYSLTSFNRLLEKAGFTICDVYREYTLKKAREGDGSYRYVFVCMKGGEYEDQ